MARRSSGADRIRADDQRHAVTTLPRTTGSVARAREWLSEFMAEHDVDSTVSSRALVVVSELVTNVLQHGLGAVGIRAALSPNGELQLAVTDSGGGTPTVLPRDPERIGGVGLRLVEELADRWGVSSFAGGKTVWVLLQTVPS
jgi:anti-sigma regulatory factor (Ser/Thr protein kinase)